MSKYEERIINKITECLQNGSTRIDAMRAVDMAKETFYRWMRTKEDFKDRVEAAEWEGRNAQIDNLESVILYPPPDEPTVKDKEFALKLMRSARFRDAERGWEPYVEKDDDGIDNAVENAESL